MSISQTDPWSHPTDPITCYINPVCKNSSQSNSVQLESVTSSQRLSRTRDSTVNSWGSVYTFPIVSIFIWSKTLDNILVNTSIFASLSSVLTMRVRLKTNKVYDFSRAKLTAKRRHKQKQCTSSKLSAFRLVHWKDGMPLQNKALLIKEYWTFSRDQQRHAYCTLISRHCVLLHRSSSDVFQRIRSNQYNLIERIVLT